MKTAKNILYKHAYIVADHKVVRDRGGGRCFLALADDFFRTTLKRIYIIPARAVESGGFLTSEG